MKVLTCQVPRARVLRARVLRGARGARVNRLLRSIAFGVAVGALFLLERRRPLRRAKEPGMDRVARNLTIGLLAAAATMASEVPVVAPVQRFAERWRFGLLRWLPLPRAVRVSLGFLLLDYTLYLWHWLNHQSPLLWRFHAVHHVDRDLDSTTGVRFHFGELALAAGFRAAQILLLGVDRGTRRAWQQLLFLSVVFHHSNLELPIDVERLLVNVIATPRMHGIHHSNRAEDLSTNFSSLLSCWDRLHATLSLDIPQNGISIGVQGFEAPDQVTLQPSLALPFTDDPRLAPPLLESTVVCTD
jgi:sterol desaturase/sphingolipid hydroxylase (fatty acid hydroxylase superfamily)